MDLVIISIVTFISVGLCALAFYEILAFLWVWLHRLEGRPRAQILLAIYSNCAAHAVCVLLYGAAFYGLHRLGYGALTGPAPQDFMEYVYYSGGAYSSLGLDNVGVSGHLQMVTVAESILGLVLIGWTVAFSYIFAEKYLISRHNPRKNHKD